MQIALNDISRFAIGLYDWEVDSGAWRAHRLPEAMRPIYEGGEGSRIRMNCPSGVRLRFVSDTRNVRLGLKFGGEARAIHFGSLCMDEEAPVMFGPAGRQETWSGAIFAQAEKTRRQFDIWLPHMCENQVLALEADDGCELAPAAMPKVRWLAYGDSITQGMTAIQPALSVVGRCTRALDAVTHNFAIGGAILDARLADCVPELPCDVISIGYGTNDYNRGIPSAEYRENARRLVAAIRARYPRQPILLLSTLTMIGREKNSSGETLHEYRRSLEPLAREFADVTIVPGDSLMPADPALFVDGTHPNDEGFGVYAAKLLPYLKAAVAGGTKQAP